MPRLPDHSTYQCDDAMLSGYLDGTLSDQEETLVETHLNQCEACQMAIESLAASTDVWRVASAALSESNLPSTIDLAWLSALISKDGRRSEPPQESSLQGRWLASWLDPCPEGDAALGRIGKYRLLEVIGQGGMGVVLRGIDEELRRPVAIKTVALHNHLRQDGHVRFEREARAVAGLNHPNVISLFGLENWRGVPIIIMPLIEGGNLADRANAHPLTVDEALAVASQVASALAALHKLGIVHRDVKPSNILLQSDIRHVLLADFGLARIQGDEHLTESSSLLGTPVFMSPEQATGKKVDSRSDLFSLGSVLYWLLTRELPFRGENPLATLSHLSSGRPDWSLLQTHRIPAPVQQLVQGLMANDPMERWRDAEHVEELIQHCRSHTANSGAPLPAELLPESRGLPKRILFASIAMLLLGGALFFAFWSLNSERSSSEEASRGTTSPARETGSSGDETGDTTPSNVALDVKSPVSEEPTSTDPDSSEATPAKPSPYLRQGPLDDLDRLSLMSDLEEGVHQEYWLKRLAALQADEIPAESISKIEQFVDHSETIVRELAKEILDKNPFVENN